MERESSLPGNSKFLILRTILILGFGVLLFRLFQLTVVGGDFNRELADGQRVRLRRIPAPRGIIYDRNAKPLARNVVVFKECPVFGEGQGVKCKVISREEALSLEAQGKDAELVIDYGRDYPLGEAAAHVLGYLGEATAEEVKEGRAKIGQFMGRTGIEEQYENILRGVDGAELIETDTGGRTIRKISKKEPLAGREITLSIDSYLQEVAFWALKNLPFAWPDKKGAVIVQNPKTGEILTLISFPSFNPNLLTKEILNDSASPLFNRAISGVYPPGSTFKIVTATAALEEGKISQNTKIEDPGEIVIGKYRYGNWYFTKYGKTEGAINVVWAIRRSTDTFFYKLGELLGAEKIISWAKAFGVGEVSGIDIPAEIGGFLPDPKVGSWFLGNTYHLSIGQGDLGLTPLQVNNMTAVIASGGKWCKPTINPPVGEAGNQPLTRLSARQAINNCRDINIKTETINIITEGMKEACSPGGTAPQFSDLKYKVACKTGTSEFDDPKGRTHAWLTLFAPVDPPAGGPEISVTVLVEAGGEGSSVAAPIAKKVLEEYFKQ